MYVINGLIGTITDSINFAAIHPNFLNNIVFNPMDGFIYGIKNNISTLAQYFTRLNPATGILMDIAPLSQGLNVGIGCKSVIDVLTQEYIIQSTSLAAIDIASGNVIYNYPIQNMPTETLDHIAFSCKMQKVFGLSNNPHIPEEYLATIDTNNAWVNHIDSLPLPVYYYKQYQSGSTIDNSTDIYYYAASGGIIYGIDINSGNVAYSHNYGPGFDFLFLESASNYYCPISSTNEIDEMNTFNIFPNPAQNNLYVSRSNEKLIRSIKVINSVGQEESVSYSVYRNGQYLEVNTSSLSSGVYFLEMITDKQIIVKHFVKE